MGLLPGVEVGGQSQDYGDSKAALHKKPKASMGNHSQTPHPQRPLQAAPKIVTAYESCEPCELQRLPETSRFPLLPWPCPFPLILGASLFCQDGVFLLGGNGFTRGTEAGSKGSSHA